MLRPGDASLYVSDCWDRPDCSLKSLDLPKLLHKRSFEREHAGNLGLGADLHADALARRYPTQRQGARVPDHRLPAVNRAGLRLS